MSRVCEVYIKKEELKMELKHHPKLKHSNLNIQSLNIKRLKLNLVPEIPQQWTCRASLVKLSRRSRSKIHLPLQLKRKKVYRQLEASRVG